MSRAGSGRRAAGRLLALAAIVASAWLPAAAHNRGVVHPEITRVAMELLREYDMVVNGSMSPANLNATCVDCKYNEVWTNAGVLIDPPGPRATADVEDSARYIDPYNAGTAASVMIGVVIEDGWGGISSVTPFNHFFHARSGVGLSTGPGGYDSSRVRGQTIFVFGLRMMDYTDQSKRRASIYLGRVLHLVEDLTSPAHIHNDAHIGGDEHDDYEGRYVPDALWRTSLLKPQLETSAAPEMIPNANKIWPTPGTQHTEVDNDTLAGFIYNRTTMWDTLRFPTNGVPPPNPPGELKQSFPGAPGNAANEGLHWVSPTIGFDRWVIDPVGEYHYKASWGSEDEWWPDTAADESGAADPDNIEAAYYIENLMTGADMTTAVVPERHRTNYMARWHPANNPMIQNTRCAGGTNNGNPCRLQPDCPGGACQGLAIVQRQGQFLLTDPPEYVAGAAMWWYKFANLPPYLKKIEAKQNTETKYTAEWLDESPAQMVDHTLPEIGPVGNTTETIETITLRTFSHIPQLRKHVNSLSDLELVLHFNEAIDDVTELDLLNSGGTSVLDIKALVPMPTKDDEDKKWTFTIPMASLTGLNGELTLKVKAKDKNEHLQGGADLDATPETPAKRNLDGAINISNPQIPWHDDTSNPDNAYDYTDGDRNHRLLLDTDAPNTTIQVTP